MKTIVLRSISGIGIITIFLAGIIISKYTFLTFFSLVLILSMFEFYRMLKEKNIYIPFVYLTIIAVVIFIMNFFVAQEIIDNKALILIIPLIIGIYIIALFSKKENTLSNLTFTITGIIYIAVPISLLNYIVFSETPNHEYHFHIILAFTILIWIYDTFAYLFGILLGKHKLFERISPKKTWEGLIGGAVITIASAFIINYFLKELNIYNWIIISAITVIMGTFGDLFESLLKRNLAIKDSGNFIPGHGGILDRFDSFFMVIPAIFLYLQFI